MLQFAALAADPEVREFQVRQHGERLTVHIVAADGAELPALAAQLRERIGDQLRKLGIAEPQIAVEPCAAIERPAGGKLPLVIADSRPRVMT